MPKVFFSWQRDTRTTEGRNFVERALERAVALVAADLELEEAIREELEIDRDTLGVPGQPPIVETIFSKIDAAAIFVPDLTFVGRREDGRPMPNPNVLIEYGYALRSLGHSRIVALMNTAHGGPGEEMPFDMRHLRWPITYNLPDGADESTRKGERDKLAKALADAIRAVLSSDSYRSSLVPASVPKPFECLEPKDGPARFRGPNEGLGVVAESYPSSLLTPPKELRLRDGPGIWLRVMPLISTDRRWTMNELRNAATENNFFLSPLRSSYSNYDFIRAEDGFGICSVHKDCAESCAVVFAFTNGEVWSVDTCLITDAKQFPRPGLPIMEEEFKSALSKYEIFLKKLGLDRPFKWIGGYEGIKGLGLYHEPPPGRQFTLPGPFGHSVADNVQSEGTLEAGMSVAESLKPLFVKLFDVCGRTRGDYLDDLNNPRIG